MKKNTIDTVLFDFDGTVMNTNNVILMSWQHTFKTLENRQEDREKLIQTFGEPLEETMKRFFPDVPTDEAIDIYRSFHRDKFRRVNKSFSRYEGACGGSEKTRLQNRARNVKTEADNESGHE